jgi:hypothetical protein
MRAVVHRGLSADRRRLGPGVTSFYAPRPEDERGSPACEDGATPSGRSIDYTASSSENASPDLRTAASA